RGNQGHRGAGGVGGRGRRGGRGLRETARGSPCPGRGGSGRSQTLAVRARPARQRACRDVGPSPRGIQAALGDHAHMNRTTGIVLILMLVATPAAAQQSLPQPTEQLPPGVVEGTRAPNERTEPESEARDELRRVPGGVDLIGEPQIKESRAANLKDVLDFTPGVWIRPRAGAADESQISIRGSGLRSNFHLRGVNILLDGYPYGNADGFSDFESLELLDTKRVEVYKGANALRFGGLALGGAVN